MSTERFDNLAGMNNINTDEIWDLVIGGERVVPGDTYEAVSYTHLTLPTIYSV